MNENKNRIPLNEEGLAGVSGGVALDSAPNWVKRLVGRQSWDKCSSCNLSAQDVGIDPLGKDKYRLTFRCANGHSWSVEAEDSDWF